MRGFTLLLAAPVLCAPIGRPLLGQHSDTAQGTPPIQDNSFLIEEAYNQEPGVVQHISVFTRTRSSGE
jgi:hypothetical protein